ncbi:MULTISPECIES: heat-inducible transcriptional repressor HrcA [Rhodomicrobium]|uniref:heat-inducible transcriptional repressor HrcA n=2 Tax=Rhodomicrobium TaxID=1068 RepID=UPI0024781223|nr:MULTISPECIES: heat-inducible transcriptional repressor HrcA [Rhodomicrobium]
MTTRQRPTVMQRAKDLQLAKDLTSSAFGAAGEGASVNGLNERSRAVFRMIIETYLSTGDPVGSRNLSRNLPMTLSPASVRNVMADLEALGLIYAPHTSAGRLPTESGLRMFVDGLLELGDLAHNERAHIEAQISGPRGLNDLLSEASEMLSGLSRCAGVVLTEKLIQRIKHIDFVSLDATRALIVLVGEDGTIENRVLALPQGLPSSALVEATNYLTSRLRGATLSEARKRIEEELTAKRAELDELTAKVVQSGLAQWSGGKEDTKSLIVRGQSHLLDDLKAVEDLERVRLLFDDLESKKDIMQLLTLTEQADGVRIFIGSENQLFSLSGSSLIVAPFSDTEHKIVGVLGVIGPTRMNYARIIPMVDYTAKLVGRLLT